MSSDLIGPAPDYISERLTQSSDPAQTIRELQQQFALRVVPDLDIIYPLWDLTGRSRAELHTACLKTLCDAVVEHIKSPAFELDGFRRVFDRVAGFLTISDLQKIPMALLEKFEPHISVEILERLKRDPVIFESCPLNVQRRIWKQDSDYFQQHLLSLLNSYHYDDRLQQLIMNMKPDSYQELLAERRSHSVTNKIVRMIGDDVELYKMFLDTIFTIFESTPYASLSCIRVDVLMKYHERDNSKICGKDPAYRFVWSLDTCVRNQNMDEMIIMKIRECFDRAEDNTRTHSDFAIILMDPVISNFLSSCIVKWLRISVDENAPSNLERLLNYNARLLNMAEHAPVAIPRKAEFPKLDRDVRSRFWNAMCVIIVEEQSPKDDRRAEYVSVIQTMLSRSEISRKVFCHYMVDRTAEGDIYTLRRCLPFVIESLPAEGDDGLAVAHRLTYESLVYTMIRLLRQSQKRMTECILDTRWRQGVVEGFFIRVAAWSHKMHLAVVLFLAEYFSDAKYLKPLGNKVAVIADFADQIYLNGYKDMKRIEELYDAYMLLLSRSERIMDGQYRLSPPVVMDFLSSYQ